MTGTLAGGQPPAMSDEKSQQNEHDHGRLPAEAPATGEGTFKLNQPSTITFAFVILALFGALIAMMLHNRSSPPSYSKEVIATLQSELDARRAELNRQRVAMGLSPLDGGSEPIGDIADRLKKDADSLVMLATRYQEMLAEKDQEMAATRAKLLDSEKLRKSLYDENYRMRNDRDSALVGSLDADRLRADLASIKDQRDRISQELALANEKLKSMSSAVSNEEFSDLQRRFDETDRAKEFFEARVKQLEAEAAIPK